MQANNETEKDLINKAVKWAVEASMAIREAGGYAPGVLAMFSGDAINTMLRNNLFISYRRP